MFKSKFKNIQKMVYCTKCGKQLAENLKYCGRCGASISNQGAEEKFEAVTEDLIQKIKTVINEGKFEEATQKFIQNIKTLINDEEK